MEKEGWEGDNQTTRSNLRGLETKQKCFWKQVLWKPLRQENKLVLFRSMLVKNMWSLLVGARRDRGEAWITVKRISKSKRKQMTGISYSLNLIFAC